MYRESCIFFIQIKDKSVCENRDSILNIMHLDNRSHRNIIDLKLSRQFFFMITSIFFLICDVFLTLKIQIYRSIIFRRELSDGFFGGRLLGDKLNRLTRLIWVTSRECCRGPVRRGCRPAEESGTCRPIRPPSRRT